MMRHNHFVHCFWLSLLASNALASPHFPHDYGSDPLIPKLALRQASGDSGCYTSTYTTVVTTVICTGVPTASSEFQSSTQTSVLAGQTESTAYSLSYEATGSASGSLPGGQTSSITSTNPQFTSVNTYQSGSSNPSTVSSGLPAGSNTQSTGTSTNPFTDQSSITLAGGGTRSAASVNSLTIGTSSTPLQGGSIVATTPSNLQSTIIITGSSAGTSVTPIGGTSIQSSIPGVSVGQTQPSASQNSAVASSTTQASSQASQLSTSAGQSLPSTSEKGLSNIQSTGQAPSTASQTSFINTPSTGQSQTLASQSSAMSSITTWSSGACSLTTFMDPSTALSCASTTITPSKETGCACPDNIVYELLSGGSSSCPYTSGQSDLEIPIFKSCPAIDEPSSTVPPQTGTAAQAPATATATAQGNNGCGGSQSDITITIKQPSLCTTSALQYSLKTAIPTGVVLISSDQTDGWGVEGSIWNFSLDDGVPFTNVTAPCQGSICTGLGGVNQETSGNVTEKSDGSWMLNVTAKMAPSVEVVGTFCGGNPVDGKVDLTITSTPPCALPVAQNCSNTKFDPSSNQWQAYSVDPWLSDYMSKNKLQSYYGLFEQLTKDYLDPTEAAVLVCTPDSPDYACVPPSGTNLEQQCTSVDATQGLLALWAVIRISNTLHALWDTFQYVGSDVTSWVNNIVDQFLVPSVKQKWEAIVSAVSSIIGVLIFIFIIIDALTEGSSTGIAVAVIVGLSNALGAASNFANGFWTQQPDDTYLTYTGQYDEGVTNYVDYMSNATTDLWAPANPAGMGASVVENSMKGGSWTNIADPFDVPHLGDSIKYFFDTLLVTSLINEVWKNNGLYVTFMPYGTVTDFYRHPDSTPGQVQFTQDDCENHWANDPKRENYISCGLNYGGQNGMTILTEPSSDGSGTISLSKASFSAPEISFTFNIDDALQSSLTGNSQFGFNYNFTTDQLESDVTAGAINLQDEFKGIPQNSAGLYNLDVCVITGMSYIPGTRQYLVSNNLWEYFWPDPCSCANFTSHGQAFDKVASPAAINATTTWADGKTTCISQLQDLDGLASGGN